MRSILLVLLATFSFHKLAFGSDFAASLNVSSPYVSSPTIEGKFHYRLNENRLLYIQPAVTPLFEDVNIFDFSLGYELRDLYFSDVASKLGFETGYTKVHGNIENDTKKGFAHLTLRYSLGAIGVGYRINFINESRQINEVNINRGSVYPYISSDWKF